MLPSPAQYQYGVHHPSTRRSTDPVPATHVPYLPSTNYNDYSATYNTYNHVQPPVHSASPNGHSSNYAHHSHSHSHPIASTTTSYSAPTQRIHYSTTPPTQIQYAMGDVYYQTTMEHVPTPPSNSHPHSSHPYQSSQHIDHSTAYPVSYDQSLGVYPETQTQSISGPSSSGSSVSQSPVEYPGSYHNDEILLINGTTTNNNSHTPNYPPASPTGSSSPYDHPAGRHHHSHSFHNAGDATYTNGSSQSSFRPSRIRQSPPSSSYSPYSDSRTTPSTSTSNGRTNTINVDSSTSNNANANANGVNKPHACDICGLCFQRGHDLKRHKDTHSDIKPHVCDCGKKFTRKDALKRHAFLKSCKGPGSGGSVKEERDD